MPCLETVYDWKSSDQEFSKLLERARADQADTWVDQMTDRADDCGLTNEEICKARLQIQTRQWLAGKFNKRYADKERGDVHVTQNVALVLSVEKQRELQERKAAALEGRQ